MKSLAPLLTLLLPAALAAAPRTQAEFVDPALPTAASILQAGDAATKQVATKLVAELTVVLAASGPLSAVEVCHLKALPLTAEKLAGLPQVTSVKRTSAKLRNPANQPDAAEQTALEHMAQLLAAGRTPPPLLLQRVGPAEKPTEWRVYRPVFIQAACLACHGEPAQQAPDLRAALQARYPHDLATGYREGDWRGFIRASIAP